VNEIVLGVDRAREKDTGVVLFGDWTGDMIYVTKMLLDGEPCNHPGCLSHISHPCEGCGRVAGKSGTIGTMLGKG